MKLHLVPDPASPQGEDAFCREIAERAPARGHSTTIRPAAGGPVEGADAVLVNGPQGPAVEASKAAGRPVALRLVDSYVGAPDSALAQAKRLAALAERVLVPSRYMEALVDSWGLGGRARLVPYAYDQIFAQQIALVTLRAARPSGFGLVTAGLIDDETLPHLESVLYAVSRLRLDCHLAVLGGGSRLAALRERARALMLDPRVTFLGGELPHPKKMEYLRAAKAFIEPSGRQGFPALALHAMSEGCPVIGASAGAVPELIRDGENGLLFTPGSAAALCEKIVTLASTPGLSLKLIAAGVRTVEAHGWDATVAAAFDAVEGLKVPA